MTDAPVKKVSDKVPDKAPESPARATYEKPTIAKLKLEDITYIAAATKSGMSLCKHTYS